jgi:hypothetical protein
MTLNILSFGITMSVSTASLSLLAHSSAFNVLLFPSKLNGLVTIPTVNIPMLFAIAAIIGAAPVPVPPHIPQVMNTISVSWSIALISASLSSAAFLQISGLAPAPSPFVILSQMFTFFSARLVARS